ncbi:transposase [Elysia marginata]|uniref:Transposase n=1 Tax=Elysia marginata TaxID=1093978 RepID=A0AAV4E9Z4_9GAST|nr:transposase [Elysia marginata]
MCAAISVGEKMASARNDHLMKQRSVIEFLTAGGCSAVVIHKRMKAVYGDACLNEGKVRKWARFYRGEDPKETAVCDRKRPGRLVSATDTMHQQKESLGKMGTETAHCGNEGTEENDLYTLLERFTHDCEHFLRSIITGDESWVHHYDPESKMQSMQYRHKNSPAPKKFKVVASARKVLLTIFWDMEGIVHIEFLEQGTTINSERYVSTLRALKGRLRRVLQDKVKDVIQHDNARPHTSRQTQCALQQLELPTIPHPPYSPDLAPSDFFLFPLLKKHLKGNHYETNAEIEADVCSWCRSQTPEFFADGMRKLVQCWPLCIECDGDYVEK